MSRRASRSVFVVMGSGHGRLVAGTYDQLRSSHRRWAEEYCGSVQNVRRDEWSCSIAVGSKALRIK